MDENTQDAEPQFIVNPHLSALVGLFFHSNDENNWQGKVIARESDKHYLVQLYSWLNGAPNVYKLFSGTEMVDWKFYDNVADWRDEGEVVVAKVTRKQNGR